MPDSIIDNADPVDADDSGPMPLDPPSCAASQRAAEEARPFLSFDQYADRQGFPLTSTQRPLWLKCWQAAQANHPVAMLHEWCDGQTVCPPQLIGDGGGLADWSCDALAALAMGRPIPDPAEYVTEDSK